MATIYNPLDDRFLTIGTTLTKNGQHRVSVILDVVNNVFYTLDDDGNFRPIGVENTYLSLYMTGNTSATTITSTNTWYNITSTQPIVTKYSNVVNDALTYNSSTGHIVYSSATISSRWIKVEGMLNISDGNNNEIQAALFKNGQLLGETITEVIASSGNKVTTIAGLAVVEMSNGDYIQIKILNATSSSNITIHRINLLVTGI
jgi:hypothetical protein